MSCNDGQKASHLGQESASFWAFGFCALATRGAAMLIQVCAAAVLLPCDYGLLAILSIVVAFASVFKDGGVTNELIRLRASSTSGLFQEAVWLAWITNLMVALIVALLAAPLAASLRLPELTALLICFATAYLLSTPWSITAPIVQTQISPGRFVSIQVQGAAVRLIFTILLLALWPVPLALVVGLFLQVAWLNTIGLAASGVSIKVFPPFPKASALRCLWKRTRWLMLGTLAATFLQNGIYLALSLVTSATTLGTYYFAYSLPAQAGFVAATLGYSMLNDLKRQRSPERRVALLTATRRLVLTTGLLTWTLAICLPYLEQLLWQGKWSLAVPAAQIVCLFYPFHSIIIMQKIALVTAGSHSGWAALTLIQGGGLFGIAALVGFLAESLLLICFCLGLYMAASTLSGLIFTLRSDHITIGTLGRAVGQGLLVPLGTSIVGIAAVLLVQGLGVGPSNGILLAAVLTAVFPCAVVGICLADAALLHRLFRAATVITHRLPRRVG